MAWQILVSRSDPYDAQVEAVPDGCGSVLAVDRFALTANVLTYATAHDSFGYWSIFPGGSGRGALPTWGEARVLVSDNPALTVGDRLFGLVPMGERLALRPAKTRAGVRDLSEHRATTDPAYNLYFHATGSVAEREANLLFRPLLSAGVTLNAWLRHNNWFGADRVIVTSASSKTALGFAMLAADAIKITGITSAANRAFVEDTGTYIDVRSYDDRRAFGAERTTIVDFTGDPELVAEIVGSLGARSARVVRVGGTHWTAGHLVKADIFFAPTEIGRTVAMEGASAFEMEMRDAIDRFRSVSMSWFTVRYLDGPKEILSGFQALAKGGVSPRELLIARPNGETI